MRKVGLIGLALFGLGMTFLFQNCGESLNYAEYTESATDLSSTGGPGAPTLLSTSGNKIAQVGDRDVTLFATFSGTQLQYSWQKNGAPYPGAQNQITFNDVKSTDQGTYRITAANAAGSATLSLTLTVTAAATPTPTPTTTPTPTPAGSAPVILDPLDDVYATRGDSVSFTVLASGSGLQYRWYRNTNLMTGCTTNTCTTGATLVSQVTIRVEVYNAYGTAVSSATLYSSSDVTIQSGGGTSGSSFDTQIQ